MGYMGVVENSGRMENKMETAIMENQMDKKMENEMETGIILGLYWGNIGIMENTMETNTIIGVMDPQPWKQNP